MAVVNVIKGDYGYPINFTVTDSDGDAVDISASSVAFRLHKSGSSPMISGACTGMNASGECIYTVLSTDLDETGTFKGELEITTGSQKITIGNIEVRVGDEIG